MQDACYVTGAWYAANKSVDFRIMDHSTLALSLSLGETVCTGCPSTSQPAPWEWSGGHYADLLNRKVSEVLFRRGMSRVKLH